MSNPFAVAAGACAGAVVLIGAKFAVVGMVKFIGGAFAEQSPRQIARSLDGPTTHSVRYPNLGASVSHEAIGDAQMLRDISIATRDLPECREVIRQGTKRGLVLVIKRPDETKERVIDLAESRYTDGANVDIQMRRLSFSLFEEDLIEVAKSASLRIVCGFRLEMLSYQDD